ncbi:hypothetical protein L596_014281 [Steinernema carpocapsae]|uniref:H15 domain-containing protein n=1 Tax=Steinernema carpocapsae TaxID=34508 RepID=A0A4U5NCK2_STECR|nr:hypothetical protein L596_014281 [Steinernema carpocapsae]
MSTEQVASEATTSVSDLKPRRKAAVKATAANAPSKKSPKKPKAPKTPKDKKAATHPGYLEMVVAAIKGLEEKKGSSKTAIVNYILANYDIGAEKSWLSTKVRLAIKRGVEQAKLQNVTGTGAAGRIRLPVKGEPVKPKKGAKKAGRPKKTAAAVGEKKPAGKAPAVKKAAAPKKPKSPKAPKKAAAAKPKSVKKVGRSKKAIKPAAE